MANHKSILCTLALLLCISQQAFSASSSSSSSSSTKHPFPKSLINEMAKREMRYHHYLWHNIRESWNKLSSDVQKQLRSLGWAPPRPGRAYDSKGVSSAIPENNSGEDFLYMHRQMIAKANEIIAKNKDPYGKITGWKTIPAPGDKDYPVPRVYNITNNPSLTNYTTIRKTNDYYYKTIKPMEEFLKNPANLRNMTLGQLGSKIEVGIHSWMHMRFSNASSYGYRPSNKDIKPNFDKKWDNVTYNWLGDTYASHVNPVFWKLHGWVDDRIEDWRRAHNLTTIRWKGTWTGGPMSSFNSILKKEEGAKTSLRGSSGMNHEGMQANDNPEAVGDVLEKVLEILSKEGQEVNFGDTIDPSLETLPANIEKTTKSKSKSRSLCQSKSLKRKI